MRIAILTLPLHLNYGGILQAYALQYVLMQLGHTVVTIDRRKGFPSFKVLLYRIGSFLKCVVRRYVMRDLNFVLCNPFKKGEYSVYRCTFDDVELRRFINENIILSETIDNTRALKKYVKDCGDIDCFVVGSDQVWREDYSPWVTNYFLDFLGKKKCKIKRYSYAASFGVKDGAISKGNIKKCGRYLNLFDGVSVREDSAIDYLKDVFGYVKAKVVLDPTLLLAPDSYLSLISKDDRANYGLVNYILDKKGGKEEIVSDVSRYMGLPKITLCSITPVDKDGNPARSESVSKWLAAFAGADFIVTDSFHGCVFSIIFKKQFIAIGNAERGVERFRSLLGNFGLQSRLVCSWEEYIGKRESLFAPIDYDNVEILYNQLKNDSMLFLKRL